MARAAHRRPLAFTQLAEVAGAIRAGGGRLTSARRALLEALFAADGPVSAEALAERVGVGEAGVDPSSVYRNLEQLERLGVVRHVHLGHGPGLYVLEREQGREYLVCERCNRVDAVDPARLDGVRTAIREQFGHHARFSHFPITGLCASCAGAVSDPRA
jgi:Fur family ferric uptake transcriptional regulator